MHKRPEWSNHLRGYSRVVSLPHAFVVISSKKVDTNSQLWFNLQQCKGRGASVHQYGTRGRQVRYGSQKGSGCRSRVLSAGEYFWASGIRSPGLSQPNGLWSALLWSLNVNENPTDDALPWQRRYFCLGPAETSTGHPRRSRHE